jgi:hypothetical protein
MTGIAEKPTGLSSDGLRNINWLDMSGIIGIFTMSVRPKMPYPRGRTR